MVFSDEGLEFDVFLTFCWVLVLLPLVQVLEREKGTAGSTLLWREALDASP